MSKVKEIVTDVSKLENFCEEINPIKEGSMAQEIILSLKATMRENDLYSLTAPQIGYNKRIICLRFGKNDFRTFINPSIENNSGITMSREKCSSIPDREFIIPRFGKIRFYYLTPMGKVEQGNLVGKASYVFQHCLDHLNGMLVQDLGLEIDELFDKATDEEREEIIKMYAESLDLRQKELNKELENNKEMKEIDDAIKFINSVRDGSTTLDVPQATEETKD